MRGLLIFIIKILTTKYRDDFIVRLGVTLTLNQWGLTGLLASVPNFILRSVMGAAMEAGVFFIDIGLDSYREGEKLAEFKEEARAAYLKATARIYTEEEKAAIRKQYDELIKKIAPVGNPRS